MTNEDSISALLDLLHGCQTFVITSHTRPDGDAIGSSLGMYHLLKSMGKQATVVFVDPIPAIYASLPGVDCIVCDLPVPTVDAAIFLECGSLDRSSLDLAAFAAAPPALTLHIDHHRSGQHFADFNWIDPDAAAVGALVYDLAIASGIPISAAMADCLYTAVLTDTGSFTFASTTASTFGLAQHLLESGADANKIAQAVYFSNPPGKVRLLAVILAKMQLVDNLAWSYLTLQELIDADAVVEDCEGVVNYLIGIAGIDAAVFLRELEPEAQFRLSLRSKGALDVSRVAEQFGGGGHRNASGCTIDGTLSSAVDRVLDALHRAPVAAPPPPAIPELC
jgi:phosphoesterase RecJ-like protein